MEATQFYELQIREFTIAQKKLKERKSIFGILRLGSVAAIVAAFYFLWSLNKYAAIATVIVLAIIFIQLIYKDLANKAAVKHLQHLININIDELQALEGNYQQFKNGIQFTENDHLYTNDMDVFGNHSLFQFLNRTTSELGAEKLASWLVAPTAKDTILQRQAAVKELGTKPAWIQNLIAIGKETDIKKSTVKNLKNWLQQPTLFIQFKPWQWLRYLLPCIIITITALYIVDILSEGIWYLFLLVFLAISFQINKEVAPLHNSLSGMVADLDILAQSIATIEQEPFTSPLLLQLKQRLQQQQIIASSKIKQLKKILDRLDLRYNIVIAIPLNIFFMWTLQQVLALEKWKIENDVNVENWFDTLAEFEAINSFATLHYNNPQWCFPILIHNHFCINATQLGHPLIYKNKRVNNYIGITTAGEIMLVTGSNMAGKSTYLRSIGVNVILAMAGAPVCANTFALSPVQLISSMRIADNLAESTSTFYAELKKLKTVIEKINAGEKVFVLLDEILRGTNSLDRHTGTEALIRQLIKQKAAAILATHDVELATLENEYPQNILNFHFDAQTKGDELFFDYKLKTGVCTNLNASLLMKKIGLEM